jgi:tryptophan synthase alpha chain
LSGFVSTVRRYAKQPLCLGFGVSTPEQAIQFGKLADGVIVGSRLIQLIEEDPSLESLRKFVTSLRKALDKG